MRNVYLGTSEFAAVVLQALADSAHRPQLVVTRPDAKRGRGQKLAMILFGERLAQRSNVHEVNFAPLEQLEHEGEAACHARGGDAVVLVVR